MNKIIKLTKVLWKNISNKSTDASNISKEDKRKKLSYIILYAFLSVYLLGTFGALAYNTIESLLPIHQEGLFIGILNMVIITMAIFTSVFSCINVLYFSKDVEYLLPLPLKPREIFVSKFMTLLIYQYIVELIFMVPCIIVYGIVVPTGILYWIYSVILIALLPIVPLILSTLIVMVIMSFSKLTKHKDRFQLFAGIFGIAIALGMQYIPKMFMNVENEFDVQLLVEKANSAIGMISNYFPTLGSATNSIVYANEMFGFLELVKFICITILAIILFVVIGERLYFRGVGGNTENATSKRVNKNKKEISKKQNKIKSVAERDLKILFRNPTFFIQCVLTSVMIPLVFFIMALLGGDSGEESLSSFPIADLPKSLIFFVTLMGIQFLSMFSYSTITAISRDSRSGATFNKTLPMPLYEQLIAKMIPGLLFDTISILTSLILIKVVIDISIEIMIYTAIISFIIAIVKGYFLILIDLKKPKLDWETEIAVVKQNMNMLYEMILDTIIILVLVGLCMIVPEISITIIFVCISAVLLILLKVADSYFLKNADKLYERIS